MSKSKYGNILSIILIVAIVLILALVTVLIVNVYRKYKTNRDASTAISDFDNTLVDNNSQTDGEGLIEQNIVDPSNSGSSLNSGRRKVVYYKNKYVMLGYIEIPKIKIKYPILEEETVKSLEQSVAVRYPSHATLNEIGNVVIVGHNYKNGLFFSNLKKVAVGDKVKITDNNGRTLIYTIYEIYETTPEDVSYITRSVGENIEITLVTCTDNSKARIIVKAKA